MAYSKSVAKRWPQGPLGGHTKFITGDSRLTEYYGDRVNFEWATATSLPE